MSTAGFSFIELMVALLLAAVVSLCVLQLLQATDRENDHFLKQQQTVANITARLALMAQDIQQAGYIGCAKIVTDSPHLPPKLDGDATHLSISHARRQFAEVLGHDDLHLMVNLAASFHRNQVILVSDCQHAERAVLQKVSIQQHQSKLTLVQPLAHLYQQGAEVSAWQQHDYQFVAAQHQLTVVTANHASQVLITNVDWLQFQYYLARDGAIQMVAACPAAESKHLAAVGIRFKLLQQPEIWQRIMMLD